MTNNRTPIIGITCGTIQAGQDQRPPRVGQNRTYVQALVRAGAAPLLIPNLVDRSLLRPLYERLDGLLLSGGGDVDPACYGEPRHQMCGPPSPERDETELALSHWVVADSMPLLAICRGIQVLNVALGGSLYQDLRAQVPGAERHDWSPGYPRDRLAHTVDIASHARLARILGPGPLPVNSLHHQAIKEVAPGLAVVGRAADQIVEAVELEGHPFAVGIQWHPEELINGDGRSQGLFDALVKACQRSHPAPSP